MYHFYINVYGSINEREKSDGVMQSLYCTQQIDSPLIEVTIEF